MKEVSKKNYEIKEICAEFENIIKKIINSNIKKNFVQEDKSLLYRSIYRRN